MSTYRSAARDRRLKLRHRRDRRRAAGHCARRREQRTEAAPPERAERLTARAQIRGNLQQQKLAIKRDFRFFFVGPLTLADCHR